MEMTKTFEKLSCPDISDFYILGGSVASPMERTHSRKTHPKIQINPTIVSAFNLHELRARTKFVRFTRCDLLFAGQEC